MLNPQDAHGVLALVEHADDVRVREPGGGARLTLEALREGAVVAEALEVIESGQPRMLEFGVADETAWKVGLSCGGTIRVLLEKVS